MDEALRDPKLPPRLPRDIRSYAALDASVRAVIDASDFEGAYEAAYRCTNVLDHRFFHHPLYGEVWVRWMWAVDLWEADGVSEDQTHTVLRHLATTWVDRPGDPTQESVRAWLDDGEATIKAAYEQHRAAGPNPPAVGEV